MSSRIKNDFSATERKGTAKSKGMFTASPRQAGSHQPGCDFRKDNFAMISDVIVMSVGNEGGLLLFRWIEPEIQIRQVDAALKSDGDHVGKGSNSYRLPVN